MDNITIPYEIQKIESLSDGNVKIVAYSDRLLPETMTLLFGFLKKQGRAVIGTSPQMEVSKDDLAQAMTTPVRGDKSPSKRLRDVLYLVWSNSEDTNGCTFETYYKNVMENIIDEYKSKLD